MPAETHVEQGPMGRPEVLELIRDRLADILEIEPSQIQEGHSFQDDLDADSLALIELVESEIPAIWAAQAHYDQTRNQPTGIRR